MKKICFVLIMSFCITAYAENSTYNCDSTTVCQKSNGKPIMSFTSTNPRTITLKCSQPNLGVTDFSLDMGHSGTGNLDVTAMNVNLDDGTGSFTFKSNDGTYTTAYLLTVRCVIIGHRIMVDNHLNSSVKINDTTISSNFLAVDVPMSINSSMSVYSSNKVICQFNTDEKGHILPSTVKNTASSIGTCDATDTSTLVINPS